MNNQIFHSNHKTLRDVKIMGAVIFLAFYAGIIFRGRFWDKGLSEPMTPQVAEAHEEEAVEITPSPSPAPVYNSPEEYIEFKWGDESDRAFLVLRGKGCGENRYLDPKVVNDNTTWGGIGRDRGIFQINDHFHPLTDAQAFDWKQNIDYAYRMYINDNHSFRRWTCGRYHGV